MTAGNKVDAVDLRRHLVMVESRFPAEAGTMLDHVAAGLDEDERARLGELMDTLLRTKKWEAARGFQLTDEISVVIAPYLAGPAGDRKLRLVASLQREAATRLRLMACEQLRDDHICLRYAVGW